MEYGVCVVVDQFRVQPDIFDVFLGSMDQSDIAIDTGQKPHVLIFDVGRIGKLKDLDRKNIFSLSKIVRHIEFTRQHRPLRHADILFVEETVEGRLNRTEGKDVLFILDFIEKEGLFIETAVRLFVIDLRDLLFGLVDGCRKIRAVIVWRTKALRLDAAGHFNV